MRTPSILRDLGMFKNSNWLQAQRAAFVAQLAEAVNRNSLTAGRTGTRCNIGRPQPRWDAGITLAREFLAGRVQYLRGSGTLSVGTRIHNALTRLAQSFSNPP